MPLFEPDPVVEALPPKWVTEWSAGWRWLRDNVWVFYRQGRPGRKGRVAPTLRSQCCIPAPAVLQFDTNGKFLQAWAVGRGL